MCVCVCVNINIFMYIYVCIYIEHAYTNSYLYYTCIHNIMGLHKSAIQQLQNILQNLFFCRITLFMWCKIHFKGIHIKS